MSYLALIIYALQCSKGHAFEAWFASIAAYDEQAEAKKLVCPLCRSRKVVKAPMAPALSGSSRESTLPVPASTQAPAAPPQAVIPDELRKVRQFMTGLRKHIEQNAEYVGGKFPDEARKIHYGETEERPIYGETSLKEAAELVEEGIDIAPMPPDLSDAN